MASRSEERQLSLRAGKRIYERRRRMNKTAAPMFMLLGFRMSRTSMRLDLGERSYVHNLLFRLRVFRAWAASKNRPAAFFRGFKRTG